VNLPPAAAFNEFQLFARKSKRVNNDYYWGPYRIYTRDIADLYSSPHVVPVRFTTSQRVRRVYDTIMATGSPSSAFTLDLRRRRRTRKGEGRGRRNRERRESDVSVIYLNAIRFWREKINDLGEPVYRIKRTSRIRLDDKFYRYAKVDISHFCRYFRSGRDARHFLLRKTIKRTTNGRRGRFEFRLRVVFKRKVILFSRNG